MQTARLGDAGNELPQYYQGAVTSCRPSRRASFPSLGGTTRALGFRSPRGRALPRASVLELFPGTSRREMGQWRRQDLLRSWGTPLVLLPCSPTPAGPVHQALRCTGAAPALSTTKAPALRLSRLNHTASALAVYASQDGLPRHHARLASGCWPDSSGRASYPQGSTERFPTHLMLVFPLSQAS